MIHPDDSGHGTLDEAGESYLAALVLLSTEFGEFELRKAAGMVKCKIGIMVWAWVSPTTVPSTGAPAQIELS